MANDIAITDLIKMTNAGLQVASFVEIKGALIRNFQNAYGSDIDLSTGTADGIYIDNLALLVNNILQACLQIYNNMNINSATGVYLDALCNLSYLRRKEATNSVATITVTNLKATQQQFDAGIVFLDQANVQWNYSSPLILAGGASQSIQVTCNTPGKIECPAGWINKTLEVTYLGVSQTLAGSEGRDAETDDKLRARRNRYGSAYGIAVLENLYSRLLEITGIEDVKVYNNNTDSTMTAKDNTSISAHDIYVIVRRQSQVDVPDETIGTILYEKLTPGVKTSQSSISADRKSYHYIQEVAGVYVQMGESTVHWKEATPIAPAITITLQTQSYFNVSSLSSVAERLYDYLNDISLSEELNTNNILMKVMQSDPGFKGAATYNVTNVTIDNSYTTNPDTYFNYNHYTATAGTGGVYTLVINHQ